MKKGIKIESWQPVYLSELLKYATATAEDGQALTPEEITERESAARQIIADFFLDGDTATAQSAIDFYRQLNPPESVKVEPEDPTPWEDPGEALARIQAERAAAHSVTDEADGCDLPFDH